MADATMALVERIEGMIDTSASYDAMGITRVCRAAMSEAYDTGHAAGVADERERCAKFMDREYPNSWHNAPALPQVSFGDAIRAGDAWDEGYQAELAADKIAAQSEDAAAYKAELRRERLL